MTRALTALLAEAQAPTILHTHFSSFDVAAAHAARETPRALVVWHEHSMRRGSWRSSIGGFVTYRLFARGVSEFLCVGPQLAEAIGRLAPRGRVRFVANGIDAQLFNRPTADERSQARARLGIAPDASVLLHFGWYWHLKGGDVYLSAVRSLMNATPSRRVLRAITVGRQEAQAAVDAAGLRSDVTVLEPTQGVRDLYAAADVFVSTSRSEGGPPLAVLEALAMGVPVVASDIPGHAFVANATAACRIAALNGGAVGASIREVLDLRADERAGEQAAARRWVLEHMSVKLWAQTLMGMYKHLLSEASRSR
jgi:glycosyltransferase involved in cell wall biosynthesis